MKICSDCKHWRKIRNEHYVRKDGDTWYGPHGECHRISFPDAEIKAWLSDAVYPIDPEKPVENAAVEPSLITKPDFGCILWELKL